MNNIKQLTLYVWGQKEVSLEQALLTLARFDRLTGFVYGAHSTAFASSDNGHLAIKRANGELASRDLFYECRLANVNGDFRWMRTPGTDLGTAVWCSTIDVKLDSCWTLNQQTENLTPIDGVQLLTPLLGKEPSEAGWHAANAPRHGQILVPVDGEDQQRLSLKFRELVGSASGDAGNDGNQIVVETLWMGLDLVQDKKIQPLEAVRSK